MLTRSSLSSVNLCLLPTMLLHDLLTARNGAHHPPPPKKPLTETDSRKVIADGKYAVGISCFFFEIVMEKGLQTMPSLNTAEMDCGGAVSMTVNSSFVRKPPHRGS